MDKAWRQNISNLCLQVGYANFDASAWVASLDVMEKRASEAEEKIRKARRARMGLPLRPGMDTEPLSYEPGHSSQNSDTHYHHNLATETRLRSESLTSPAEGIQGKTISNGDEGGLSRSTSLDNFTNIFNHLQGESINSINYRKAAMLRNSSGSFLDKVLLYIQAHNLPFEHVHVWVMSKSSAQGEKVDTTGEKPLRLLHAGHATRCDIDPELFCQFHEYGDIISNFSYLPGAGLPGRAFEAGKPTWECSLEISDPNAFGCADVAESYGIKTGVGIPLSTHADGRIVIVLYSIFALEEDTCKAEQWMSDLASLCPRPKWRLVVESCGLAPASKVSQYPASLQSPFNLLDNKDSADELSCVLDSIPTQISVSTGDMTSQEDKRCERNSSFSSLLSTSTQDHTDAIRSEETAITTLLADHMPDLDFTNATKISVPSVSPHCFMSLRLLLLRAPHHCTPEENKFVEMIRARYDEYCKEKDYSQAEIAKMLAKDWSSMTLVSSRARSSTSMTPKDNSSNFPSQTHSDSLVSLIKSTCAGIPSFTCGTRTGPRQLNGSIDANILKKRRLLDDLEDAINIVDDDDDEPLNVSF